MSNPISTARVSRRQVLAGAAAVGAVGALAACGSSTPTRTGAAQTGPVTVPTSDVPVGGGKILADSQVVVTQPAAGTFKAFSAVCPHQGCLVGSVADGTITCPCHGSQFSAADGAVKTGPANRGLAEKTAKVDGANITVS
jgi:Rieske Fe-S protein